MSRPPARGFPASIARIRRQMLVERLLVDVVGIPWSHAHIEADLIGPAVSERVEARIASLLGDPGTCPHGNPIPGSRSTSSPAWATPLGDATGIVSVARVAEHVEEDVTAMELLESAGLIPGRLAEVVDRQDQWVVVLGPEARVELPPEIAAGVYVTPCVDAT